MEYENRRLIISHEQIIMIFPSRKEYDIVNSKEVSKFLKNNILLYKEMN